jgi:hypothetical protein
VPTRWISTLRRQTLKKSSTSKPARTKPVGSPSPFGTACRRFTESRRQSEGLSASGYERDKTHEYYGGTADATSMVCFTEKFPSGKGCDEHA